jgi:hypothetical protein
MIPNDGHRVECLSARVIVDRGGGGGKKPAPKPPTPPQ